MNTHHVKLPRRVVDLSALADASAVPDEALMLLSPTTAEAMNRLPDEARLEVRDLLYELGRTAQNTAFPTVRVDLDLELQQPQDWCAVVSLQGHEVRTFEHTKPEQAFALGVREAVIQLTSIGIRPRGRMIADWSIELGRVCEQLDELSLAMREADAEDDATRERTNAVQVPADLEPNEGGSDAG